MSDDVTVIKPDPDDYSFTFKNIQNGYAAIEVLLRGKAKIRRAIECYAKICDHPVAAEQFSPENSAEYLKSGIRRLRRAAEHWKHDPQNNDFQKVYAQLVGMAYTDCAGPLALIDEATNVLKKAIDEDHKPDSTMRVAMGMSDQELQQSYVVMSRIRLIIKRFADSWRDVSTIGNMVIGPNDEGMGRMLGRPVKSQEKNEEFTREALFWGITGMLCAEKDTILSALAKVQPPAEGERLREGFLSVTDRISDYARFAIEEPKRAVALMQADIPRCLAAFGEVQKQLNGADYGTMDVLIHCVSSLRDEGPDKNVRQ